MAEIPKERERVNQAHAALKSEFLEAKLALRQGEGRLHPASLTGCWLLTVEKIHPDQSVQVTLRPDPYSTEAPRVLVGVDPLRPLPPPPPPRDPGNPGY